MIRVEAPGLRATVQDSGRYGHLRDGVPHAGPADPFAFRAALALVGAPADAAAIEVVGLPFTFHCDDARVVAVTGRDVSLVARDALPGWMAVYVRPGTRVMVVGTARTRYAYVAVSGGIATPAVLGSRAAYPRAGLGGALAPGDALPLGGATIGAAGAGRVIAFSYGGRIRAVEGPHEERFSDGGALYRSTFLVAAASDRQGVRLEGPPLASRAGEILTFGVVAGAIQVPHDGRPIVLLADHQTTGGYPVIATVIAADLGLVAQAAPGEELRFERIDREGAVRAAARRSALLAAR